MVPGECFLVFVSEVWAVFVFTVSHQRMVRIGETVRRTITFISKNYCKNKREVDEALLQ